MKRFRQEFCTGSSHRPRSDEFCSADGSLATTNDEQEREGHYVICCFHRFHLICSQSVTLLMSLYQTITKIAGLPARPSGHTPRKQMVHRDAEIVAAQDLTEPKLLLSLCLLLKDCIDIVHVKIVPSSCGSVYHDWE